MTGSYRSSKTEVRVSPIEGQGLFAVRPIGKGKVVAVKGGHILDGKALPAVEAQIADSFIRIGDGFFIGALRRGEVKANKLYLNHSCNPNLGIRGEITFVAMRSIRGGEELTYDWAMEDTGPTTLNCRCGGKNCRGKFTRSDWRISALQKRLRRILLGLYRGKIQNQKGGAEAIPIAVAGERAPFIFFATGSARLLPARRRPIP